MKPKWHFFGLSLAAIWVFTGIGISAEKRPMTGANLALYSGADRQQILEEGAKKEGKLTFYTSLTWAQQIVDAFQKKYPYLKVEIWRADGDVAMPKIIEEHKSGKHIFDVVEGTQLTQMVLQKEGITQPFYSPNLRYVQENAITKAPGGGAFQVAFRESGVGLGYNTKLLTREQAPKTYQDLLDPKWKGKFAIPGNNTGWFWVGTMLGTFGEEFVKQIAQQNCDVHMIAPRALLDMIINGEYPFSPTIFDSHVMNSKQKGAPCEWIPLEPVYANIGQVALSSHSPHPHATLLFIDFEISKEVGEILKVNGYNPTRQDVPGATTYKKYYGPKSAEEGEKWYELFQKLFLKK